MTDPTQNGQQPQGVQGPTNPSAITSQEEYFKAFRAQGMGDKQIMQLMGSVGFDADSSYNMIVSDYEEQQRKLIEDRERFQQLLAEQREAYDGLLKKKDSPFDSSPGDFESGGIGAPEAVADPLVYQLGQNDKLISESVAQSHFGKKLLDALSDGTDDDITKLIEQGQASGLFQDIESLDQKQESKRGMMSAATLGVAPTAGAAASMMNASDEYSEEERVRLIGAAKKAISEGKSGYEKALKNANELNAQLGIDRSYNPYSDSDFQLLMMESFDRTVRDEDEDEEKVNLFLREKLGETEDPGFFDYIGKNLSTNIRNAISGMALFQAENFGSELYTRGDSDLTAAYYKDKIQKADAERQALKNEYYKSQNVSEKAYQAGLTERAGLFFDGEITAGDFVKTTAVETANVMADGFRTAAEVMLFKSVPLAVDLFGSNYGQVRTYSPHISKSSAIATSAAKSAAEFVVQRATMRLGIGAEGLASQAFKTIGKKGLLQAAKREIASDAAKKSFKRTVLKNISAEGLEEAIVEVTNWSIDAIDAVANGRNVKDLNPWQVVDSFFAGMAGGAGIVSIGAYASNQGHTRTMKARSELLRQVSALNKKIETEVNPDMKAAFERQRTEAMAALKVLTKEESELYDSLNDADKAKALRYNQDITNIKQILTEGRYWDGSKVTKEEKKQLEERLGAVLEAKAELENSAVEQKAAQEAEQDVAEVNEVPDASEQAAPAQEKVVTKEESESHERIPEATEAAPADQQQEEGQLSMFDETTMAEMATPQETPEAQAEEAPVEEAQEEDVVEETEQEDVFEINVGKGEKIDLSNTEVVGDAAGQIPIPVASAINKMTNAFRGILSNLGTKVKFHKTDASFGTISPEMKATMKALTDKNGAIFGYYDKANNTIHLNNNTEEIDAFEEFGHAVLENVIGRDAESRQRLFEEMERIAKGKTKGAEAVAKVLADTKKFYANRDEATQQEEAIISVLVNYAKDPNDFVTVKDKIRAAFNRLFKGLGVKGNVIKGDEGLFELADKFRRASQGVETTVDAPEVQQEAVAEEAPVTEEAPADVEPKRATETDEQFQARLKEATDALLEGFEGVTTPREDVLSDAVDIDSFQGKLSVRQKKEFTYLKDTEVFYTHYPSLGPNTAGISSSGYTTYSAKKSVKVNDYFHFRNWYNKQTGNQRASRVRDMYFIKDGKKYTIKPPKPKVDQQGKPVYMELPMTFSQRRAQAQVQRRGEIVELRRATSKLGNEIRQMFKTLPWNGFVNVSQFAPPMEASVDRTPDQDYRAAVIAKKNLQAAMDMGLTKEDILKRLDDSGRGRANQPLNRVQDGDILNSTGMFPFDQSVDGEPTGMFAIRSKEELSAMDIQAFTAQSRSFFKNAEEGDLDELKNLYTIVMGYDRTGKRRAGITSGIRALLGLPNNVLSTHVNRATAQRIKDRFVRQAIKIQKETGRTEGQMAVGFSILNPEATIGNPDVFDSFMDGLAKMVEDGTMSMDEFILSFPAKAHNTLYNIVANSDPSLVDFENGVMTRDAASGRVSFLRAPIKTEVKAITKALKEAKNSFSDPFSTRKKFYSSSAVNKWLDSLGAPKKSRFEERLSDYYNDSSLPRDLESATLTSYKTFNYKLVSRTGIDGRISYDIEGLRVDVDESQGFSGVLRVENPTPLKALKEVYKLEDLDPDFKMKSRSLKEEAEAKDRSARDQALLANQYSLFEFNADASLLDTGMASIRTVRGLTSSRTDQGAFELSDMTAFQEWRNKWVRRLQDKYIDIFRLQEDVERSRGARRQDQDFRMAEELMYGKAAEDLAKSEQKIDEITEEIREKGLTVQEVSDYLYALHAKERNALIEERTEGKNKEGSGWSNEKADGVIDSFGGPKREALDSVVKKVRELQQDTRDTMVKFGLESQETIDAFEQQFKNYVPLSGIAVDEDSESTSEYPNGGAGFFVHGDTYRKAEGRTTEATNILARIVAQNAAVHIKARTNEALQSLYNLVENNPNEKVWKIIDGKNAREKDPHVVGVRVNGEQKFIRFRDASYAETLRNMNLPTTSFFVKMLRVPSNIMRRAFTTLSPEFMISNFSRDIQTAVFNAAAEADIGGGIIEGNGIVLDMIKQVPKTMSALIRAEQPEALAKMFKENPLIERYYQDFKDDGGKTGWGYAKPLDKIVEELEGKAGETTRLQNVLGKPKQFASYVEGMNDAFENGIRLAAYIAAREKGVSREKSAQMAKNITVNFNKSGEYGQMLNAVYLFFNASVQGTARLGRSLLTFKPPTKPDGSTRTAYERINNAQKIAGAMIMFSGLSTMLALAMSDEDEDGELFYNKIPDYIKERNLIIMRPDGKNYYKIPLPYGYSMFNSLGRTSVEVGAGHKEIDTAMMELITSTINSFSPISFGQSEDLLVKAGKSITPTVFKPLADIMANETYFGGPVRAKNLPYGIQRPESSMSFRSPDAVKQMFKWLNEVSGGSTEVKGDLDFNPDTIWYIFEYFVGSAGKFVTRAGSAVRKMGAKAENSDVRIEANDLPFLRILYGEPSKYMDIEDYSKRKQEIQQLYRELKNNPRRDKPERYKGVIGLNNVLKNYEKSLAAIRKAKRKAQDIDDYTDRMVRIQELQDKERKMVMAFNKYYEQVRGKN